MSAIKIYDPRQREIFNFGFQPDGRTAHASDHVVVQIPPQVDISNVRDSRIVRTTFEFLSGSSSGYGVVSCLDAPQDVLDRVLHLSDALQLKGFGMGYFPPTSAKYEEAKEIILAMEYGAICIGNLSGKLTVDPHQSLDLARLVGIHGLDWIFVEHLNLVNWAIVFDTDNAQTTFVCRINPAMDPLLEQMRLLSP